LTDFIFHRIKGLTSIKHHDDTSNITRVLLFSVSSDGVLKAWSFQDGKVGCFYLLLKTFDDVPQIFTL
jgi:hypothetical protein